MPAVRASAQKYAKKDKSDKSDKSDKHDRSDKSGAVSGSSSSKTRNHLERLTRHEAAAGCFKSPAEEAAWRQKYDANGTGVFERDEFHRIIADLASDLETEDHGKEKVGNATPGWYSSNSSWCMPRLVPPSLVDKEFKDRDSIDADEIFPAVQRAMHYVRARAKVLQLFDEADTDQNGNLNASELRALLQRGAPTGYRVTPADSTFVLSKCDVDGDDNISLDELGPALATWMEVAKRAQQKMNEGLSIGSIKGGLNAGLSAKAMVIYTSNKTEAGSDKKRPKMKIERSTLCVVM